MEHCLRVSTSCLAHTRIFVVVFRTWCFGAGGGVRLSTSGVGMAHGEIFEIMAGAPLVHWLWLVPAGLPSYAFGRCASIVVFRSPRESQPEG